MKSPWPTRDSCAVKEHIHFSVFMESPQITHRIRYKEHILYLNPYPTAFPYGNGTVLHFYQQQESSTTKTVHKVINKGLKTYV